MLSSRRRCCRAAVRAPPCAGAAEQAAQLLGHRGPLFGERTGDPAGADQANEVGVHRLHADRAGSLDRRVDLVGLRLADQIADRRIGDQDLAGDDASLAVGGRQQLLGDDALQRHRELGTDLLLLLGREDVDDPVDRLRRRLRVQGREDEVAGLGRGQRGGDRLEVAHLADQDHVGVLAQRGPQPEREVRRVRADLTLVDDRAFVAGAGTRSDPRS